MDSAYEDEVNWKRPALLALAVVIVGSLVYWYEYVYSPKAADKKDAEQKLFTPMDAQIASIKVNTKESTVAIRCLDMDKNLCRSSDVSRWEVVSPIKTAADRANVVGLLSTLQSVQTTETLDLSKFDNDKRASLLKEYKLDEVARTAKDATWVELELKAGKKRTIYVGNDLAIEGNLYAIVKEGDQLNTNKVWIASNYFKSSLNKPLSYWRDKKILDWAVAQVTTATIRSEGAAKGAPQNAENGSAIKAVRDPVSGRWNVGKLDKSSNSLTTIAKGDTDQIEAWLNSLLTLMAKDFVTKDKLSAAASDLKNSKKVLSIEISRNALSSGNTTQDSASNKNETAKNKDSETVQLALYEAIKPASAGQPNATRVYLTVSSLPQLFEVEPSSVERLRKRYFDLRQSKLLSYQDRFAVKKALFNFKGEQQKNSTEPVAIALEAGKWEFLNKGLGQADHAKIQTLMDRLVNLRIRNLHTGKLPYSPFLILTLQNENGETLQEIRFAQKGTLFAEVIAFTKNAPEGLSGTNQKMSAEYFELDPMMAETPRNLAHLLATSEKKDPTKNGH